MSSAHQIASFRKVSAGILASAHLAAREERPQVAKRDLSLVLKRVAPALGVDGTAYHVLDILLGLVQADDFNAGRRPVVAISNQRLAEYTRRTPRTVTRCLKKLVEVGILAYRDSPTGRRYVYQNTGGSQDQAYGLDFTPACFNFQAFKDQAASFQRRIKALQEAKRAVTRFSRALVDLVDALGCDYQDYISRLDVILDLDDLEPVEKAKRLEGLYLEAVATFEAQAIEAESENETDMSSAGDIGVSPLSITTPTDSFGSNRNRTCSNEQEIQDHADNGYAVEEALEKEPGGAAIRKQYPKHQAARAAGGKSAETNLDGVSIGLIKSACSNIQEELGLSFSNWAMLCNATDQLRMLIGLSPAGYQNAVERQGRYLAAACLAVVAEKALRNPEQITSPGGYFRAMIDRAGDGKLHLHKSLHGLV
ncbi:plasmid replication protein RepC [Roseibium marinum]|uniref:Replication initiation protein RepC n=1 Tax=Roseibium marinum TaxID=281252 RepID=A0A2S3UJH4_9HYPH|nr:plasmid replication protein RepC [Roseibium marinum]POF27723.1 replication initiation protein RepC [Roseibium marinum]